MVDYIMLEEKIKASGKKMSHLANACGMHINTFKEKRDGKSEFTVSEAEALSGEIGLSDSQCLDIFFAKEVHN